ncbi:GNAT family N-acetyltransferase [Sphingomonas oryzagri]|uniref:GNAT family N-acetyltransferase n=1 Tax=Sphingomonas oryzagri TaxID=3042314 RepID=A0ABT6N3L1_9SPHN|nr:GNAT family N-acetyltransferase [Sphingomonas oryzagri]MDH7639869.1 GNAT family N-acetyltransferase [Sphingomonas oryzagri]
MTGDDFSEEGVDTRLLHAWLAGRSIARGLPAPVPEHGGYRVETGSEAEIRRWVFPRMGDGLVALGRTIRAPRQPIKLCGAAHRLQAALPDGWRMQTSAHVMRCDPAPIGRPLPAGYAIETQRRGTVVEARILASSGQVAASGYAGETAEAFVYDRIETAEAHRRRGLGGALMTALGAEMQEPGKLRLLVATDAGRALYERLGWRTIAPYSTAFFIGD